MCIVYNLVLILISFCEFSEARLAAAIEKVPFLVSMQTVHMYTCSAQRIYM